MKLTKRELRGAVIGMVIGDGCLSIQRNGKNAYYQMSHGKDQYEYLLWKQSILDNISRSKIYNTSHKAPNGKFYDGYHLNTQSNPFYTALCKRFYYRNEDGKRIKSLDEYLVKSITPLGLAIMFMDDGCIGKAMPKYWTKETFYLCLDNFDYANLFLLKKSLKILFNLEWNINKTAKVYYQLRLLNSNNQRFVDIVYPYIKQIPSMLYKLGSYVGTSEKMEIQSDLHGDMQSHTEMNVADLLR